MRSETYDPFGWRLEELDQRDVHPVRRVELVDDLLVAEAEEIAHGRRHLTIVHGEPTDLVEAEGLEDLYDAVGVIAAAAEWSRLAGRPDYLTIAIAGRGRDEQLAGIADVARRTDQGHRPVLDAPYPSMVLRLSALKCGG